MISTSNVGLSFGGRKLFEGVNIKFSNGNCYGLIGANGAGKTTTLKAVSNLLHAERGEVTKGNILFEGEEIQSLSPSELVRRGCIQVMEGRHCFGHLTIEENLMTGAYTRKDGRAEIANDLEKVYSYFPRLKERRRSLAGLASDVCRHWISWNTFRGVPWLSR